MNGTIGFDGPGRLRDEPSRVVGHHACCVELHVELAHHVLHDRIVGRGSIRAGDRLLLQIVGHELEDGRADPQVYAVVTAHLPVRLAGQLVESHAFRPHEQAF